MHADLPEAKPTPTFPERVAAGVEEISKITFERRDEKDWNEDESSTPLLKTQHHSSNGNGCFFWRKGSPAESEESKKHNAEESKQRAFRLLRVRNRYDRRLQDDTRGHLVGSYRDFAIKMEIGFETSPIGTPWFVPVGHWDAHNARRMVVELQGHVRTEGSSEITDDVHKRYVEMRNALCI
jgi:hypothetical protein